MYVHIYLPGTQQHKTATVANAKLIPMEIQLTSAFIFNKSFPQITVIIVIH